MDDLARRNNLSPPEFRQILERDGYDIEALREDIREELLVARVQRRFITNRVTVSQRDVDDFLATVEKQGGSKREYRLAHILISVPEGASPEDIDRSREEAQALVSELRAGKDFAEAAVARSDGRQALKGGDLGWRKANELPTLFADIVPTLAPREVSEPIRSPSGFHIVQVVDSRRGETHVLTQTRARHILLVPNEVRSDADARAQLAQLRERIVNGDDFVRLARAHSDDPGNAAMGGDLGWLSPGGVLPALQEVIDTLEESELSAPLKTERGWHLVQVVERRAYDGTEEVRRAGAVSAIRNRKIEEELQTWIRRIREEAYVELRLDEE
jgi:peptidyl-prolyl cis-trans isomerase SurA